MSNLAGVTKDMYPEGTVATVDGLTGPDGVALVTVPVTVTVAYADSYSVRNISPSNCKGVVGELVK